MNSLSCAYQGAPAFSTPSERVFSSAGNQVWNRRNQGATQKVEEIMFIYENEDL